MLITCALPALCGAALVAAMCSIMCSIAPLHIALLHYNAAGQLTAAASSSSARSSKASNVCSIVLIARCSPGGGAHTHVWWCVRAWLTRVYSFDKFTVSGPPNQ